MQSYSWRSWTRRRPQPRDRPEALLSEADSLLSRVDVIIDFSSSRDAALGDQERAQ